MSASVTAQEIGPYTQPSLSWSWPVFLAILLVQLWVAHALAFFAHEYAHAFTAWVLGWKANPLLLHYPPLRWQVVLLQFGINQNVDEQRIFAAHHDAAAGLISAAGMVLGNALFTLPLALWGLRVARRRVSHGWGMLFFWIAVASVGNLIDYLPVRTFVTGTDLDQDMYAVERGFGWSPWFLLLIFGVPAALVLAYLLWRTVPSSLGWIFPQSSTQRALVAVLTSVVLFGFYGAAGISGVGPVAHRLSMISVLVGIPSIAALELWLTFRRARVASAGAARAPARLLQ